MVEQSTVNRFVVGSNPTRRAMNNKTKNIGNKTEITIISEFINRDIPVSIPFGDNQRYDVIIDVHSKLYRIQIKTSVSGLAKLPNTKVKLKNKR